MKFRELKKSLTVSVSPIYLICGDDAFLVERSISLICSACLEMPELNLTKFEGADLKSNVDKLISALMSYPFMSAKRVVLVREYYPLASDIKALKSYFDNPCETTVFVIANSQSSDNLSKQKNVMLVDCSKGDEKLLLTWINATFKSAGLTISQQVASMIIDCCNSDMTRVNGEVEKLISYCLGKGVISEEDVSEVCIKETDYQLFEVVNFIASSKRDKAYSALEKMVGEGDGQKLFVSLYYHFRRLLYVSVSNDSVGNMAQALGVKEYAVKKAIEQSKSFSPKRLKAITDKLSQLDASFKSGKIMPDSAVWNGIFDILTA